MKIHYCWFGGKKKSRLIKRCIESWRKYFPETENEFIEWNESNFDVNHNLYTRQAYEAEKYAFVSDYVRFWALEKFGGIYFDTDVEVIKPFGDILEDEGFAGFETKQYINPGQVLYARNSGHEVITKTREYYDKASFLDEHGQRIKINVCGIFTKILSEYGFVPNGKMQICGGFRLYPIEYFCPYDDATGILTITPNTYSIHWYAKSWMPLTRIIRNRCSRILHRLFGTDIREKFLGGIFKHGN